MSWTCTGNQDGFFQTGRNSAEARFWKLKIHEEVDRRQTKSSIAFEGNSKNANDTNEKPSNNVEGTQADMSEREKSASPQIEDDYKYSQHYTQPESDNTKDYQYSYVPAQEN